jgi:hypothetical protein
MADDDGVSHHPQDMRDAIGRIREMVCGLAVPTDPSAVLAECSDMYDAVALRATDGGLACFANVQEVGSLLSRLRQHQVVLDSAGLTDWSATSTKIITHLEGVFDQHGGNHVAAAASQSKRNGNLEGDAMASILYLDLDLPPPPPPLPFLCVCFLVPGVNYIYPLSLNAQQARKRPSILLYYLDLMRPKHYYFSMGFK